jgi:hypothetical protein
MVPEDLPDLGHRCPLAEHSGGESMAKGMRTLVWRIEASPAYCPANNRADG